MTSCLAISMIAASSLAEAGGMVLPVRGVRTLARAGANVAGAADADALWDNPAGLAHGAGANKRSLLFDVGLVYQAVEHTRIDADGNLYETITNQQPSQLVPTLAGALGIGDRLVIAGGLSTPYAAVHRYAVDGPARHASVSLRGSTFVLVTLGAAYQLTDRLRIGATIQDLFSKLSSGVVMSGCPETIACAPDDRSYDMPVQIEQTDYVAPSGSLGVQLDASDRVTVGVVAQAPTRVSANGKLAATLPTANFFDGATLVGDDARVSFTLPPTLRAGVETRITSALRAEVALAVELWSMHDEIAIAPGSVRIEDVTGGPLELRDVAVPRDYSTSLATSVGVEWHGPQLMLGAGYAYETAAAPAATVSVRTVDAAKHLVAIGGGYEADGWQIGVALGFVQLADVDVAVSEARVPALSPLRDTPVITGANAGSYASYYLVGGLRFARRW